MSARTRFAGSCVLLAAAVGACASPQEHSGGRVDSLAMTTAPTLDELRNGSYMGLMWSADTVTLKDGRWEERASEGMSPALVNYVRDLRLAGDLDGDGAEEAVAFVAYSAGGSGVFYHLAVAERFAGGARSTAVAGIGDRVQFRDARLDGRRIVLDLVQGGAEDAACCPGDLVTRSWELRGDSLVEGAMLGTPGRLSLETIGGAEWRLTHWDLEEPVTPAIDITIRSEGGKLAGRAACNRYSATATAGGQPGDLSIGPPVTTEMACPEPQMQAEKRFLAQLAGSNRFGYFAGKLAFTYRINDTYGTMLFVRKPSAAHAN